MAPPLPLSGKPRWRVPEPQRRAWQRARPCPSVKPGGTSLSPSEGRGSGTPDLRSFTKETKQGKHIVLVSGDDGSVAMLPQLGGVTAHAHGFKI